MPIFRVNGRRLIDKDERIKIQRARIIGLEVEVQTLREEISSLKNVIGSQAEEIEVFVGLLNRRK